MAGKKRTLRSKISTKTNRSLQALENSQNEPQNELPADPKHFLHAYKPTKKEKVDLKHTKLITKLTEGGISKSALRRRKRKAKEELVPKMQDLLTSLDANVNLVDSKETLNSVEAKKKNKNLPNPLKQSGSKIINNQEKQRFGAVLKDSNFKKSPFSSLRESISNRLRNDAL